MEKVWEKVEVMVEGVAGVPVQAVRPVVVNNEVPRMVVPVRSLMADRGNLSLSNVSG